MKAAPSGEFRRVWIRSFWVAAVMLPTLVCLPVHAQDATPPSVPANLTATPTSSTEIVLTWEPSIDNDRVAGYYMYVNDDWQNPLGPLTGTSYRHNLRSPATTYTYRVSAFDAVPNHSQWTNHGGAAVSATTPAWDSQNPAVPPNLVATVASPTQIDLSWGAASDNVGVTGYRIHLNDAPLAETTATSFKHAGLTPSTLYSYRVSAFDAVGNNGSWTTSPVTATTVSSDTQDPSVPSGLSATPVSATQINLSWNASTDNLSTAGYIVYVNDNWMEPLAVTRSTSFQHIGLSPSTSYSYRVSAFDATPNHSAWSTSASTATPGSDGFTPTTTFTSMLDEFPNPERGLSRMIPTNLSDLWVEAAVLHSNEGYPSGAGYSFRLTTHRQLLPNTDTLDQSFIYSLNKAANIHRTVGTKMAMQFSYDNDDGGAAIVPSLSRILGHIAQLEGFFKANADVITTVHGGFLGLYGEWAFWQGGAVPSAGDRSSVRDALYAAVSRETPIGFRTLADLSSWYPTPLSVNQAFYSFDDQARSGVHHDCWLYDDNGAGTYWDPNSGDNSRALSNPLRQYHSEMSEWTTMGGENCGNTTYSTATSPPTSPLCTYALEDGPRYRWRYRRDDWGTVFNSTWDTLGCYAEIKRSLGYRFQLDAISHPSTASRNAVVNVALDLRNVGWSRIFSPRRLVVSFRHSNGTVLSGLAGDMRFLPSQASASTRVVVSVPIPGNAPFGAYDVYISMPDVEPGTSENPLFAVRFANAGDPIDNQAWESDRAWFRAGTTLTIQ